MKVRVRNPQFGREGIWFFEQPQYFEYQGEPVEVKWAKPDELALTTGDPEFPIRFIQRSWIESIDGQAQAEPTQKDTQRIVRGSKGQDYILTQVKGRWTCSCSGFQFRRNCRHVQEAALA